MKVTAGIELKQGQQLVMTPQLQQAIKLLQLTNLELSEYVDQQLEQNPFLEIEESGGGSSSADREQGVKDQPEPKADAAETELTLSDKDADVDATRVLDTDIENIAPEDSAADRQGEPSESINDWSSVRTNKTTDFGDADLDVSLPSDVSLRDFLIEQLHLATRCDRTVMIGVYLVDLISETGYLRETIEDIAARLGTTSREIMDVLHIIHKFEPTGIGARDLRECLALQLRENGSYTSQMALLLDHLEMLAKLDYSGLQKLLGISRVELSGLVNQIRSLDPKPADRFRKETVQIVVPDVFLSEASDGGWKLELNSHTLPKVLANQKYYAELSESCVLDADKSYLTEQMSHANWLVRSLDQRARTILKVASELVRQQDAFFVHGVRHLKPLNLKTIADAIDMHESTVSRVTANKYLATGRGIFEMKYFFTSAVGATTGDTRYSAEAVRDQIRSLIEAETADDILSDDRIVSCLNRENIDISRRTVAKYREAMNIASSIQRRRMKRDAQSREALAGT